LPTPVQELPLPPGGRGRLFVKRDDLTSSLYGGNKVRKFEYLLAEAEHRNARALVGVCGIGSNLGVAAALHGRARGLRVELSLAAQPVTDGVRRNLRGMLAADARVSYATTMIMALWNATQATRRLRRAGAAPFLLPIGATNAVASLGYVAAALELAEQVRSGLLPMPTRIYVAAGSCGTAAGLVVGCRLAGLKSRVMAIRIAQRTLTNEALLLWETRRVAWLLSGLDPRTARLHLGKGDLELVSGYSGTGYGAPTREAEAALAWAAPGLSLETTYTGKALAACLEACRSAGDEETILFWNTFNSAPFALADNYEGLPPALAAMIL
jgi:D-cysteine desulfhydrase